MKEVYTCLVLDGSYLGFTAFSFISIELVISLLILKLKFNTFVPVRGRHDYIGILIFHSF